jgi:hypothetical protein
LAEAFQTIGYPILPEPLEATNGRIRLQATHPTLITPRDFDVSPYFEIVKPTIALGFDPYQIELVPPPPRPRVPPTPES